LTDEYAPEIWNEAPLQSPSYWAGKGLGIIEPILVHDILVDAAITDIQESPPGSSNFKQRFELLDYIVVPGYTRTELYKQGRFEYELQKTNGGYGIFINVYWKLVMQPEVTTSSEEIIERANTAIADYWGAHARYHKRNFELVSRSDRLEIPIKPRILPFVDDFCFTVSVYPDNVKKDDLPGNEAVNMDQKDPHFTWDMRETNSFRPVQQQVELVVDGGGGPHEVGHMMGIPHDPGDYSTVMSDIAHTPWRYFADDNSRQFTDRNTAYASHFKIVKVWAEIVFANKLGRLEDFFVFCPTDEFWFE